MVLAGGGRTKVSRRGQVVFRTAEPWSASVHALLRHLEDVGFVGAPRVVEPGFDAHGRETVTFVDGESLGNGPWTDDAAASLGVLLRTLHNATASFVPPDDSVWQDWFGRGIGRNHRGIGHRVIGHCDTGPWNIVVRNGQPFALIDWEMAGPVEPIVELAQLCWLNAQLHDDDVAEIAGLPGPAVRANQLRLIADGYGLPSSEGSRLVDTMIEVALQDAAQQAIEARILPTSTDPEPMWGLAWRARAAAWMSRNRRLLESALG